MRRSMSMLLVVLLGAALAAPPAFADEDGHAAIVWVGTVATNVVYMPLKLVHATMGAIVGGLGWLVTGGNPSASNAVFDHSIYSSWYVTPEMLEGKEDLYFFGADD